MYAHQAAAYALARDSCAMGMRRKGEQPARFQLARKAAAEVAAVGQDEFEEEESVC